MPAQIEGLESRALLDGAVIDSLRELGGDDLIRELVDLFLSDAPSHLAKIRSGVEQRNAVDVERLAHTLKSSAANLGAMRLSEVCRRLEETGRNAALDLAREFIGLAEREFSSACDELKKLCSRNNS